MPLRAWARRVARPPRRAIPTRAGVFVLGTPMILVIAAVTSSNNLLFILIGAMMGAVVLSGILSERNLRGVQARARAVGSAYAGEVASLEVRFERRARSGWLERVSTPQISYGLVLLERSGRAFRRKRAPEILEVHLTVLEGARAQELGRRRFEHRGLHRLEGFELSTVYPFGLLTKSRDMEVHAEVLVRPKRVSLPPELSGRLGRASSGETSSKRGVGLEVYGLREREERDPLHRVHALRSLALQKEVVIETTGEERPSAILGVDNRRGADPTAFERALEIAQAVLLEWDRRGYALGLSTATERHPPGALGLSALQDVLARLQLQEASLSVTDGLWLHPEGNEAPPGEGADQLRVRVDGSLA